MTVVFTLICHTRGCQGSVPLLVFSFSLLLPLRIWFNFVLDQDMTFMNTRFFSVLRTGIIGSRAVDPHSLYADPDPAVLLYADPDTDPDQDPGPGLA